MGVCVGDPLPIPIFERSVPRFSAGFRQVWWRFGVTIRFSTRAPLLAVPPPPRAHNRPTPTPGHRRQSSDSLLQIKFFLSPTHNTPRRLINSPHTPTNKHTAPHATHNGLRTSARPRAAG